MIQPEARYWLCRNMGGHFFAAHALGGQYNVGHVNLDFLSFLGDNFKEFKDFRHQGWFAGAGIGYGYSWILGKQDVYKRQVVIESGFSRLPVYEGTDDNIKGVLYSRDLLPYIGCDTSGFDWTKLIREPYFVPESRMIDDLLEDFRRRHIHMAIVIDEFGGTQGIVTLEDVLEEIVGDINDEYDEEEVTYKPVSYTHLGKNAQAAEVPVDAHGRSCSQRS